MAKNVKPALPDSAKDVAKPYYQGKQPKSALKVSSPAKGTWSAKGSSVKKALPEKNNRKRMASK